MFRFTRFGSSKRKCNDQSTFCTVFKKCNFIILGFKDIGKKRFVPVPSVNKDLKLNVLPWTEIFVVSKNYLILYNSI